MNDFTSLAPLTQRLAFSFEQAGRLALMSAGCARELMEPGTTLRPVRNGNPLCDALPGSIDTHQLPCGHERFEEFFGEERVALGATVERVKETCIDLLLRIQHGPQHGRNVAA